MVTTGPRRAPTASRSAAKLAAAVRSNLSTNGTAALVVGDTAVELPADLVGTLLDLLDDTSEGRSVTSAPASLPIGTELASRLLGVSRPWLTTLLDRGEIPSTRTGSKRRLRLGDVLDYRRADDARRQRALTWEFLDEESAR